MGTGYTRNDTANNIADGNVINASDLDGEFDAVQAAFNGTTGHSHDGTTGEGPQIAAGGIANNAVTTAKILDANVTTAKIADSNVTTAKIANANVTLAKMAANSVDSDQYVDGSIDRVHLAADIVDGTKIADDSINSEHYVDGSIDTAHIGNLQVTTAKIAADAIDGTKLADNAVNSEHYTDGSIDRVHLAADIIDGTKIADDVINSEHYVAGSIDAEHLASSSVTTDKIAADAVTTAKIADSVSLGGNPTTTTQTAGNNTTRIATTAFVTTAVNNAEPFPSGTSMLFQQTAAPTGWTKQTTHNDKALRIITGTVGTGGSSAFSTAFGTPSVAGGSVSGNPGTNQTVSAGNLAVSISGNISNTTLSTSQIPSHRHHLSYAESAGNQWVNGRAQSGFNNNTTIFTGYEGGGGSHNHGHNLSGSMTGSPTLSGNITAGNLAVGSSTASINVQYVDFIIANKD